MRLTNSAKVLVAMATDEFIKNSQKEYFRDLTGNAVIASDRLVREDVFTTAPVKQFEVIFQETLCGMEQLTREVPMVNEEKLECLDERGIVKIGTRVKFGDILVGKVVPYSDESELDPEKQMLRAIFNEPFTGLRNASLYYPRHDPSIVTDVQVIEFKKRRKVKVEVAIRRELRVGDILQDNKGNQIVIAQIVPEDVMPLFKDERVDILVPGLADICSSLHRYDDLCQGHLPWPKKRGKTKAEKLRLEKTTLFVEDKVIARSIGPYSLTTQMPLAADSGAQAVKPETVQALVQQGFATNARELLSIKSDSIQGREKAYRALVEGKPVELGIPESTNVLLLYLKSLGFKAAFDKGENLQIVPVSKEDILQWSHGEVRKPETINYRTLRSEKDGLFCEAIFGPTRDWECACGRYKRLRHKGIICEKCGVEVTEAVVRRERMGHIQLVLPMVHYWYFKPLATILGLTEAKLRDIIYFSEPVDEQIGAGPNAIKALLETRGIDTKGFIIEALPVLPPELRLVAQMKDKRFATADVNDLYQRVISRNNRVKRLIELRAPEEVIINNEHRMLQESVDSLIDNLNALKLVKGPDERPLRSLATEFGDTLARIINKRVDFSAKGIVIPDSALTSRRIGLPLGIAIKLFEPIIMYQLCNAGEVQTLKAATTLIKENPESEAVKGSLEAAMKSHPLLVISPTNNILGLCPIITDGEAIRLHPEVGANLGLRFAGEQVTLHTSLTEAAIKEVQRRPEFLKETVGSVIAGLKPEQLVEHALAQEPIKLSILDKIALGIGA